MTWFCKKRTYAVHYQVNDYLSNPKRHFIVKASDIAEAAKLCQKREIYPISIIEWEVLDNG